MPSAQRDTDNIRNRRNKKAETKFTGSEADNPDEEEIEVGDAGADLVHLIQPAPRASLVVVLCFLGCKRLLDCI